MIMPDATSVDEGPGNPSWRRAVHGDHRSSRAVTQKHAAGYGPTDTVGSAATANALVFGA